MYFMGLNNYLHIYGMIARAINGKSLYLLCIKYKQRICYCIIPLYQMAGIL